MTENTVLDNNVSSIIKFKDKDGNEYPEWEYAPIGTVCEINPKPDKLENEFYYIDLESVEDGKLLDEKIVFKSNAPSRAQRTLKENDILFQMVRPYQKNNYFFRKVRDKQSVASTGYAQIRSNNINPMFVYEFIFANKFVNDVLLRCTGSNYPAINSSDLKGINISIPCKEEQSKIALFLSSIDNLISIQESSISILETYNKGLLNDIFERKIKFKNENGEKYPDWEEKPLSEEFPFIRNGFVGIVTDHFSDKEHGIRYIEGTNIHNGRIDDNVEVYVTEEFHQKHKKNELKADDIIMVQSGHVGDCAVVGPKYAGSNCHALIIMSNGGKVDSHYVAKYFLSDVGKKKLEILKTGNTVKHILSSDMNKFKLPFPCLEEQQKIADCLFTIDKVVEQEKVYLEQLKTIKKGLLQQMFV